MRQASCWPLRPPPAWSSISLPEPLRCRRLDKHADRLRGHALFPAQITEFLVGLCLDVDLLGRHADVFGDARDHLGDVRRQLRLLGDDGGVDVANRVAGGYHAVGHFAQQGARVGAGEHGVGVRKMLADVAQGGGAQHGVDDGVQQDVGVRVAEQAEAVGNGDAADDELAALDEGVAVIAGADAKRWCGVVGCECHGVHNVGDEVDDAARYSAAVSMSRGSVTFRLRGWPSTSRGVCPSASMALASSVMAALSPAAPRAARSRSKRNICGVCASHRPSRGTVCSVAPAVLLTVSTTGRASRPPTGWLPTASIRVAIRPAVRPGRAASCTSIQSLPATSRSMACRPFRMESMRVAPPQRRMMSLPLASRGAATLSIKPSSGLTTT